MANYSKIFVRYGPLKSLSVFRPLFHERIFVPEGYFRNCAILSLKEFLLFLNFERGTDWNHAALIISVNFVINISGEWDDTGGTSTPEPAETPPRGSKNSNNRFDQLYHFELSEATEITWGTADMQFGLQVMKEQIINKNYYYDFRVTTQHGSQLDYSAPDTVFDFITTNFPLVEVKFFETELRRVFSTIIIPDAPLSSGSYGKVALEIWFCWLGRHPVVGKSQIFWHMLRYTKSKDWHSDKSHIKKVGKFVKSTSMVDFLRNKEIKYVLIFICTSKIFSINN